MFTSWKQIAGHLQISVKTAQRYEELHGLPVRRQPGNGHPMVHASPAELDSWRETHTHLRRVPPVELDYRALFEKALDAILIADDARRYIAANDAACDLLGYSREEILTKRIDDVLVATQAEVEAMWASFLNAGEYSDRAVLRSNNGSITVHYRARANYIPGHHSAIVRPADMNEPTIPPGSDMEHEGSQGQKKSN